MASSVENKYIDTGKFLDRHLGWDVVCLNTFAPFLPIKNCALFFSSFFSFFVSHKVVLLCMYKREVCFRYIIPNLTEVLPLHTLVNCVKETPLFA